MTTATTIYDSALRLMRRRDPDFEAVRRLLENAIAAGEPRAFYALATWYLHGTHVRKSLKKGAELLKVAADHKVRDALFDLAVLYEQGRGVPKDKQQSFGLFREAADGGDPEAMTGVGRMLYYGIGVAMDRVAADLWLTRAEQEMAAARDGKNAFDVAM